MMYTVLALALTLGLISCQTQRKPWNERTLYEAICVEERQCN